MVEVTSRHVDAGPAHLPADAPQPPLAQAAGAHQVRHVAAGEEEGGGGAGEEGGGGAGEDNSQAPSVPRQRGELCSN